MVEATTVKLITCFRLRARLLIVDDEKHKERLTIMTLFHSCGVHIVIV